MGRGKKQGRQPSSENSVEDASTEIDVEELPPETAEDFLHVALRKSDLVDVMRILRDWYGREEIKNALKEIHPGDRVDQFTRIRRHAVELYAKNHKITPSTLMVKLLGVDERKDAAGTERHKLQDARERVEQDSNAFSAAHALAECWEASRPEGRDPVAHLKKMELQLDILSSELKPEF